MKRRPVLLAPATGPGAEDTLFEELDWFFLVTGRAPARVRAANLTVARAFADQRRRPFGTDFTPPKVHAFYVYFAGAAVDIVLDPTVPFGSWRAE